ncbi:MAG: (2Fe-2S) ferredoxin domain-containing protein [Pegethrix bostrychoides GSE-TBD4-15B]|jgi:(2Fe-2S) ferredoxin|uniref:(2Fe-2S) ferredoxin domain-containing protein n=1 Tax=Pegethrix bostrychoides GSE-TBD4-15B TaxID=2839662 RepID=A0A951U7G1_9CYAN|nr:(2Fe-2S) ferredoxin domain-containing protein [Pegethrix bostrychoides GSE-TBD4-15B]
MSEVSPRTVLICQYRSCQRQGSSELLAAFEAAAPDGVQIIPSDCMGQCATGVTVRVMPDDIWYWRVRVEHLSQIVQRHLCQNQPVIELLHSRLNPGLHPNLHPGLYSDLHPDLHPDLKSAPETQPDSRE